jgi:uncharacterized protein YgiM (DUF1202 family)
MLYATFRYVRTVRGGGDSRQGQTTQTGAGGARAAVVGSEHFAVVDVNIRKGPDSSYDKIGLAESGSRVKVLKVSGNWYQVQVVEHSRPKADPDSADEGWVNSANLRKS